MNRIQLSAMKVFLHWLSSHQGKERDGSVLACPCGYDGELQYIPVLQYKW